MIRLLISVQFISIQSIISFTRNIEFSNLLVNERKPPHQKKSINHSFSFIQIRPPSQNIFFTVLDNQEIFTAVKLVQGIHSVHNMYLIWEKKTKSNTNVFQSTVPKCWICHNSMSECLIYKHLNFLGALIGLLTCRVMTDACINVDFT